MRKNKKLLLASVAAMGALALGVGATSTFAWYSVTGETASLVNKELDHTINASADSYTVSALEIKAVFANHSPATDYTAQGSLTAIGAKTKVEAGLVYFDESGDKVDVGDVGDDLDLGEVTQYATAASFAHVELSDDHGYTYFYVNGSKTDVTAQVTKWYGTADVVITIKLNGVDVAMNTANAEVAAYAGTYTVTTSTEGDARVRASAPTRESNTSAQASAVVTTITIAADGKVTTSLAANGLTQQFWYLTSPHAANDTEVVGDHSSDGIKITIAKTA